MDVYLRPLATYDLPSLKRLYFELFPFETEAFADVSDALFSDSYFCLGGFSSSGLAGFVIAGCGPLADYGSLDPTIAQALLQRSRGQGSTAAPAAADPGSGPEDTQKQQQQQQVEDAGLLLQRPVGYICLLGVAPQCRRLGLGSALLDSALKFALSYGASQVCLHTMQGNAGARNLYSTAGFTRVATVPDFYTLRTGAPEFQGQQEQQQEPGVQDGCQARDGDVAERGSPAALVGSALQERPGSTAALPSGGPAAAGALTAAADLYVCDMRTARPPQQRDQQQQAHTGSAGSDVGTQQVQEADPGLVGQLAGWVAGLFARQAADEQQRGSGSGSADQQQQTDEQTHVGMQKSHPPSMDAAAADVHAVHMLLQWQRPLLRIAGAWPLVAAPAQLFAAAASGGAQHRLAELRPQSRRSCSHRHAGPAARRLTPCSAFRLGAGQAGARLFCGADVRRLGKDVRTW